MYLQMISLLTVLMSDPKKDLTIKKPADILPKISNLTAQDCVDSRLRPGKCITLTKCPDMVEEFYDEARKTSYGIDFQTFISNSICGFDGVNFLRICCGTRTLYPITMTKPPVQIQNTPTIFAPTRKPFEQLHQTTQFLFAPLGSYVPPATTASSTKNPSSDMNNTPTSNPMPPTSASTSSSTPDKGVIILQPTMVTPSDGDIQVMQPIPGQTSTQDTLISQPVQQPVTMPSTPLTCGVSRGTTNRVVGGYEAKKGNYPWMAALGYRDEYDPSSMKFLCAGSLISSRYVITSAHCINSYLMLVRLGAHDLTKPNESEARNYRIKRTVTHEKFNLKTITNDLALIELSEIVQITNFIDTICLPEAPQFLSQDFVGMNPFVAGWGANKHQGPTSNVLRDVQVPIINRQVCEQSYRTVFNFVQFSDQLICAGNSNVDACQGDSGGPLMLPQMSGQSYHYYLLGVVSFGYECARTGFPGVYTKVAAYLPWIKSNMI
ncbi:proclotting enzyme-like [Calliphora vicina]|uniref:proclotting enzyme-like n=1 Tax=Calliphora vicina TaxID=7373 RepID=UPI00325AA0B3